MRFNRLRVAQDDFVKHGYVTNYPTSSYHVTLSTNLVTVGGTQYQCFAEVSGGWGWEGGRLRDDHEPDADLAGHSVKPPMIITVGHRPPIFGGPY